MKGRVVLLDEVDGRATAALMVDGHLEDLLIDPTEDMPPAPGAIYRAVAERPMKGQGGITLRLPEGHGRAFLRQTKGIAPGDVMLVQVSATAELGKAVPVTPKLLFKSRYAIVTPGAPGLNISRAIRDDDERDRLLEIAHAAMDGAPDDLGLILRSAAEMADAEDLAQDITAMRDLAEAVVADTTGDPECLVDAPDAHALAWRDWALPAPDEVVTDPGCFETHGVLEAVDAVRAPHLPLTGGGAAWIEPTRALVAVDVNTGADTSLAAGLKANFALAKSLPRALRIKGLAGQVVLDLAPMPKKDRRGFEETLRKAFRADGADVVLAGWSPLGNYELQRKRDRFPLRDLWPTGA